VLVCVGVTRVRYVDTKKVFYQVSQSYMFKLQEGDLKDKRNAQFNHSSRLSVRSV
jgi:hypothetical protein